MTYVVVYEQTPNNWSAYVPDLPGCVAAGDTREETEEFIREAMVLHLDSLRHHGDPIPEPGTWTSVVDVNAEVRRRVSPDERRAAARVGRGMLTGLGITSDAALTERREDDACRDKALGL